MQYFNFLHAPNGGGYQNSISFLRSLVEMNYDFSNTCLIVFKGTGIHRMCVEFRFRHIVIKESFFHKMFFELVFFRRIQRGDIVFSIFGPPFFFTKSKCLNIGGIAISNVFYKNVDFWGHLPVFKRIFKKIKDIYRVWRYKRLDYWIFETDLLQKKAVIEFGFPEDHCLIINMAPGIVTSQINNLNCYTKPSKLTAKHKFLFLSGAHPNKRLHILPWLAEELLKEGIDFQFILTAEENSYLAEVLMSARNKGVLSKFINIGSVPASCVAEVISWCDYICTFSVLESFSNNFVEAWLMKKPLFVTDADWSRDSCKDAAIYIDFENKNIALEKLIATITNDDSLDAVVSSGIDLLSSLPTPLEKAKAYLQAIEYAKKKGKLSTVLFKGINL